MDLWFNTEKSLLYKNEGRRKQIAKKLINETFNKYITHKYLPRSFNDPGYIDGETIPSLLKTLLKYSYKNSTNNQIVVLEIGSFMGLSSKYMIKEIEGLGMKAKIHSIDLMRGYYEELSTMNYSNQGFHLLDNTERERLENKLVLHAGKSAEVLPELCLRANFCYIDGEHTSGGVYADLALSLGQIKSTGILLVDDVSWKDKDTRSVVYGILTFIKNYKKYILTMFALGVKDGKYGFFEIDPESPRENIFFLKTKQLLIIAKRHTINVKSVMDEIKKEKLYLSL